MADRDRNDNGGFFAGVVLGGVAGFVAGMVLAPKSGDETRELFSERGQELRDKADELIAAVRERVFATSDRYGGGASRPKYPYDELDLDEEDR